MPRKKRSTSDVAAPAWALLGPLTIEHAAESWRTAADTLAATTAGHLDLSGVDRIDSAGLQVLIAMRRTLERRGVTWRLTGCSSHVLETIRHLGGTDILGIDTQADTRGQTS